MASDYVVIMDQVLSKADYGDRLVANPSLSALEQLNKEDAEFIEKYVREATPEKLTDRQWARLIATLLEIS